MQGSDPNPLEGSGPEPSPMVWFGTHGASGKTKKYQPFTALPSDTTDSGCPFIAPKRGHRLGREVLVASSSDALVTTRNAGGY